MKYDTISRETAKRVLDTFESHDCMINRKYESFKGIDTWWSSDRERFVGMFFKRFIGKHFILIDKEVVGFRDNIEGQEYCSYNDPVSIYSPEYRDMWIRNRGEPIIRAVKKYLKVGHIRAVNSMDRSGFIEMVCYDSFFNKAVFILDRKMLECMQFKEISSDEYDRIASLFVDDRDDQEYRVARYLTSDEMKSKGIRLENGPVKEVVTVTAKDAVAACKKCSNAIEVEQC